MPLQTSGAISLNQIHIEAGGTSGTTVSLNDSDIRSLGGVASGAIDFADFYGASAGGVLTEGGTSGSGFSNYGFSLSGNFGSISPSTHNGATIQGVYSNEVSVKGSSSYGLFVQANGNQSTSWFSSISIAGVSHAQSSFGRAYTSSTNITTWSKTISGHLFDGSGTTAVVFS